MLLSPLCPLLFQPLLAAAQKYSQTLELGKLGIYLQGFAMERKREEEETRGCFSRNPVLRMQDFFPADLQADSLKESEENNGLCKKNDRKTKKILSCFQMDFCIGFAAQPLCSSAHRLPALHRNVREKWWHTHTHANTDTHTPVAEVGGLWQGTVGDLPQWEIAVCVGDWGWSRFEQLSHLALSPPTRSSTSILPQFN